MVSLSAPLPIISDQFLESAPILTASILATTQCEPCGYLYQRRRELQAFLDRGMREGTASNKHKDPTESSPNSPTSRRGDNKKVVKLSEEDLAIDWYDMLKLVNAEGSSEDQIRTAYRKRCLETHPDKQQDKSDELFKQVQRAFEILGDPDARRAYDSSRPFDDAIPGDDVSEEAFYKSFEQVFERNKKWSMHPLPSLGDETTSIKLVERFYDAWMQFHSWRDFSHECELDEIDDSMCREEKRYYQRENERILSQLRKQEVKRVRTLVERARKNDPRLRKRREEEEARREQEKREREAEKQRLRDEEQRRRDELATKDRLAQEQRHQAILDAKNIIRTSSVKVVEFLKANQLHDPTPTNMLLPNLVRQPNIHWFFNKATTEEATEMAEAVTNASCTPEAGSTDVPAVLVFNKRIESKEQRIGVTRYGEPVKKVAPVAAVPPPTAGGKKQLAQWSDDDLVLLQKAIAKFPGGTVDRWRRISVMMREKFSEEDVLVKTKELEAALKNAATGVKTTPPLATATPGAAVVAEAVPPPTTAPTAPSASAAPTVEDWTPKQQKQLEQVLRDLKDYKEKDKYQKVAAVVEGKTAKQCFDRFKYLCTISKKS